MTERLRPVTWAPWAGFGALAAVLGLLAGYNPEAAVVAAVAIAFVVVTMADLRAGLAMFVIIIFIETAEVVPGLGLAKVAGAAVAFSWLALVLTDPGSRRFLWSDHPILATVLVALLAWLVISATWAEEASVALDTATTYLLNAALLPIVYTAIRTPSDLRLIAGAFVIGAGGSALLGLVSPPDAAAEGVQRLTSTIGDPNELAATLAAGFVLSMALAYGAVRGSAARSLLVAVGLGCVIALLLTASRGGIVALIAALAVAPFLTPRRAPVLAGIAALAATVAIYLATVAPPGTFDRFQDRDGGSGRTDIWTVAWRVIEDQPVAGVGVGNFPSASVNYVIQPGALPDKRTLIAEPTVAHNIYLEVWAELGLIGLVLFVAFLAWCLGLALAATRAFKQRGDTGSAALASGVALALIVLLAAYFFLSEQTGNKLWLLLALCPALASLARQPGPPSRSSS